MLGVIIVQIIQFVFSVMGMMILLLAQKCDSACSGNFAYYLSIFYTTMLYFSYFFSLPKLTVWFSACMFYIINLFLYPNFYYLIQKYSVKKIYQTYVMLLLVIIAMMIGSGYCRGYYAMTLWYASIVSLIHWFLTLAVYCNFVDQRATTIGIAGIFLANY